MTDPVILSVDPNESFLRENGEMGGHVELPPAANTGGRGQLLTDSSIADELKTLVVQANYSMAKLQVTLKNLQNASGNLQIASTILPAISDVLGHEAQDLPGLVLQTQTSMRELERLIEAMQRHWLLRKYVNKTNPAPLRPLPVSEEPEKKPVKGLRSPRDSMSLHERETAG